MKIGFFYNGPCNLLELTQNPTANAATAVCQLAIQLAKLGNEITIFSQSENASTFNVRCRHIEIKDQALVLDPALLEPDFSVLIFKNSSPEFALSIKGVLPYKPKIFVWTEHDHLSPLNKGLLLGSIVAELTGIICVSPWQRSLILDATDIPQNKIFVLKYAISPFFEDLFVDGKEFINTKAKTPQLAYIAKQDNGLDILLDSYFNISDNYSNSALGVFTTVTDQALQASIAASNSINVYGELSELQLAAALRTFTIFASPNTIATTYNVPLLEAMAAGLYPVVSAAGANQDYCQGHGKVVLTALLTNNTLDNYISEMLTVCSAQIHQAESFYDYCYKQTVDINKKHTWSVRAKELLELLDHSV